VAESGPPADAMASGLKLAPPSDPEHWHWRTGRKVGRTIYVVLDRNGRTPSDRDPLIGVMDSERTPGRRDTDTRCRSRALPLRPGRLGRCDGGLG
jgi:hypothetical protein